MNEEWKQAKGVVAFGQTNSALAPRNYDIRCKSKLPIADYRGYWIWWCENHHQPLSFCDRARLEKEYEEKFQVVIEEATKIKEDREKQALAVQELKTRIQNISIIASRIRV